MDPKILESLSERSYVSPIYIGIVYGALGERNQEFALYTKAYEDRRPLRHRPEPAQRVGITQLNCQSQVALLGGMSKLFVSRNFTKCSARNVL